MSERKELPEEEEPGAPLYMLSFGDMMTNLLCFFILLCAFAEARRVGFITDGVGSIRRALLHDGLPGVLAADSSPIDIGADRVLFQPNASISPELLLEDDGTISDRNRDALRQVVTKALKSQKSTPIPAYITFRQGSARLSRQHRTLLSELATRVAGGNYKIRVEGFAGDEGLGNRDAEWQLALQRAENVISFLSDVGDIPNERFVQVGFGPAQGTSTKAMSQRQQKAGRRSVLITLLSERR